METKIYPFDWKDKVILVVEDDIPNFKYFEFLLKEVYASVVWVKNGLDAIEICCSEDTRSRCVLVACSVPGQIIHSGAVSAE